MTLRAAVLVASDRVSAGTRSDGCIPAAAEALEGVAEVVETAIVPDDYAEIRRRLIEWSDAGMDLIITSGGTGLSPRDVTPEATRSVVEREVPGISAALVLNGLISTPRAMLSRAVAGVRGRSLIINLPGKPSAVRESLEYLRDVLPHAVEMARGAPHADDEQEQDR